MSQTLQWAMMTMVIIIMLTGAVINAKAVAVMQPGACFKTKTTTFF